MGGGGFAGADAVSADLYVQKELMGSTAAGEGVTEGGAPAPPAAADANAAALRYLVATVCGPRLLDMPPSALASVRFTYFATMRADASVRRGWLAAI